MAAAAGTARNRFTGGYEDRYSASVAGAQAMLDASPSQGRFDDVAFDDSRSEYADAETSVASPATSSGTIQRMQVPPRRVHTSEDASRRRLADTVRSCGCGAPFRGYSSVFTYMVGFGWLLDAVGANTPAAGVERRIRRSMSSRIAVDASNPTPDDN